MAFGTGSAMAHQAVGAVVGAVTGGGSDEIPRDAIMDGGVQQQAAGGVQQQAMNQSLQGACAPDKQMFFECLKVNQGDQQSCSFLYEALQTCQRNDNQMSFQ